MSSVSVPEEKEKSSFGFRWLLCGPGYRGAAALRTMLPHWDKKNKKKHLALTKVQHLPSHLPAVFFHCDRNSLGLEISTVANN